MSNKNKIAIFLLIIVASLAMWLYFHNSESTIRKELYDFEVKDTSSITKIYMARADGKQITLEKVNPGYWQVDGKYKARPDAIKFLLGCIKDLRVRNPVEKNAIENVSKQFATSGTKVEIYKGDNLIKTYYVGSDTQDGLGTFMLLTDEKSGKNSTMPFVMCIPGFNGFLSVRYFVNEEEWRDRSVFAFLPDRISSLHVNLTQAPDSSFTFSLSNDNKISLANSKGKNIPDFDTLKAKQYLTYYSNIQFEGFKNDLKKSLRDSLLKNGPVHIISLKDRDGKEHTLKTFRKAPSEGATNEITGKALTEDKERMYALINDDKDWVTIQYYVFGKLFQNISHFKKSETQARNASVKK